MQTRRDLYQAHRLMLQRVGMALLAGEPDVPEPPMRRLTVSVFAGAMVAVLGLAAFGIWGLLSPGGATGLTEPGVLIIEKETGTKYVYSQRTRKLHPVANYTSARLILDTPQLNRRVVSQKSLNKFQRGLTVGILGAPDSLPDAKHQVRGPWSICVHSAESTTGRPRSYASLVGGRAVGGRALGDREAVVVRGNGDAWVVWRNQRMKLPPDEIRPIAGTDQPPEVSATWLNALPVGVDFKPPAVPNRGTEVAGPGGGKATVGTFYRVQTVGGDERWYVLLTDGLAPIKQTEGVLLQNDQNSRAAYRTGPVRPIDIDAATANSAQRSSSTVSASGLPDVMPKITPYDPSTPLCAVYADTVKGSLNARVTVGGGVPTPGRDGASPSSGQQSQQTGTVDQVVLPPGDGALIGLLPGPNQLNAISSYAILTDQGRRYALPSADVAAKLGFDAKKVAPVPGNLLHLIPEGPALNANQAHQPLSFPRSGG